MSTKIDIKTAGRTLDVFEAFETLKKPVTLSELAAFIDAPVSSCHGLVRTLRNRGYLYSIWGRSTLYPTKRLLDIASTIAAHDPILLELAPALLSLRDETLETVILGKWQEDEIVYLDVVEGPQTIRYVAKTGKKTPLHSSAIGKAMLGTLSSPELADYVARNHFDQITDNTLTSSQDIIRDIEIGRERGYFVTRGENVADVMGVACAVYLGRSWLGVAIAGPLSRMEGNFDVHVSRLLDTCRRIRGEAA